jgi:hypothetical protein
VVGCAVGPTIDANWGFVIVAIALFLQEGVRWLREGRRTKELANNKTELLEAAERMRLDNLAAAEKIRLDNEAAAKKEKEEAAERQKQADIAQRDAAKKLQDATVQAAADLKKTTEDAAIKVQRATEQAAATVASKVEEVKNVAANIVVDQTLKNMTDERNSYKELAHEATKNLELAAAASGSPLPAPVAPVIPEHSSPSSQRQRDTAELQTMRARLVAATLHLGLPPREASAEAEE